jgi:hypothetical protein
MTDRLKRPDLHVALAGHECALQRTMSLQLPRWAIRTRRYSAASAYSWPSSNLIFNTSLAGLNLSSVGQGAVRTHLCSLSDSCRASSGSNHRNSVADRIGRPAFLLMSS